MKIERNCFCLNLSYLKLIGDNKICEVSCTVFLVMQIESVWGKKEIMKKKKENGFDSCVGCWLVDAWLYFLGHRLIMCCLLSD